MRITPNKIITLAQNLITKLIMTHSRNREIKLKCFAIYRNHTEYLKSYWRRSKTIGNVFDDKKKTLRVLVQRM